MKLSVKMKNVSFILQKNVMDFLVNPMIINSLGEYSVSASAGPRKGTGDRAGRGGAAGKTQLF